MTLKIKKMNDNAILPTRGDTEAAGIDLYACIPNTYEIAPGSSVLIGTGIACEFPEGYFGAVVVRSSIGIKRHLALSNQVGVIDNSYRNEILVSLTNMGDIYETISPNERIAQMILLPYVKFDITETDELSETERGMGGIGSTGRF